MDATKSVVFAATVLPLVCTPGPDLIYIAAQALAGGRTAALRANAGVLLGYVTHAVLAALGIATLVAASPILFETLRWCGVAYLAYLAIRMIRSAIDGQSISLNPNAPPASLAKGFMTSFFNPKGLLVYLAILPNFMNANEGIAQQAVLLSGIFIGLCALVYGTVGIVLAAIGRVGTVKASYQRVVDGIAGSLLAFAAVNMARN
ncbi:LysE family translocator [Bradyrhizobium sp. Arg237L]|uniref:LysE family translocator n=1 Tax=Bradyrhizobium sp. Arg237L TaxID=3003352 RepID=UPI00249F2394|nr:LysE family translocator [Bradyrhizobium sp. Arg237L]MDI4236502.1 LysE family translocator [Bradyrhizobium sp. Arg237L]